MMDEEYPITEIGIGHHRLRQRCLNPDLGFVRLADFYGPFSEENAKMFLRELKEKRRK